MKLLHLALAWRENTEFVACISGCSFKISDVLGFSFKLNGMETRDALWILGSAFNALPLLPVQLCLASKTVLQDGHISVHYFSCLITNKHNASVVCSYTVFTVAPYFNN